MLCPCFYFLWYFVNTTAALQGSSVIFWCDQRCNLAIRRRRRRMCDDYVLRSIKNKNNHKNKNLWTPEPFQGLWSNKSIKLNPNWRFSVIVYLIYFVCSCFCCCWDCCYQHHDARGWVSQPTSYIYDSTEHACSYTNLKLIELRNNIRFNHFLNFVCFSRSQMSKN